MKISGLAKDGARQADQLLLTDRQQVAAFTDLLVITFRETHDEFVRPSQFGGSSISARVAFSRP
jgi:hypothetical protein